ncbi:MAG: hypothetical protein ABI672_00055 [Vicinamibacteria bacterium]
MKQIWGTNAPSDGTRARRTRYWGELASWYPALSYAAGVAPVASFSAPDAQLSAEMFGLPVLGRNIDFSLIGGTSDFSVSEGFFSSHSYLNARKFSTVWKGFRAMQQLFSY